MDKIIYGGVSLIDLSPTIRRMLPGKPRTRPLSLVHRAYVHHSGTNGARGRKGAINSARFVINVRGWSRPAYHYWLPREPDGSMVEIYQMAPPHWRCYHTKGAPNIHGIGIVLQGDTNKERFTQHQEEGLEAILAYVRESGIVRDPPDGRSWLSWHSDSGQFGGTNPKPSCPGRRLEIYLEEYRDKLINFMEDSEI